VNVEIVDEKGRFVPTADNEITFTISSNGKIIGVDNGDPTCHILPSSKTYPAFNGLQQVIVQSGRQAGTIILKAEAEGLQPAELTIEAEPCSHKSLVPLL